MKALGEAFCFLRLLFAPRRSNGIGALGRRRPSQGDLVQVDFCVQLAQRTGPDFPMRICRSEGRHDLEARK